MDIQTWVIGQTAIEIIIIILMLWFIKSHLAMRKKNAQLNAVFEKPEQILAEMRELTRKLDKNLEEKKEISNKMLGQLDDQLIGFIFAHPFPAVDEHAFRSDISGFSLNHALIAND